MFSDGPPPRTISVVLDDNFPPYSMRDASGELQGILRDRWMLWQARTGIAVDLRGMDWGKAQEVMGSGGADVIEENERPHHPAAVVRQQRIVRLKTVWKQSNSVAT